MSVALVDISEGVVKLGLFLGGWQLLDGLLDERECLWVREGL